MDVAFYIARRYLFSSRSKNAVNIITSISVLGVSIGSLALVVVLSVFNGFESIIKSQFNPISSDFIVSPINSKEFSSKDIDFNALKEISSWESIKEVYEEKVLLRFDEYEQISKLKGVRQLPNQDSLVIEKYIFKGRSFRSAEVAPLAIIGQSIAHNLSISVGQFSKPLKVFAPNIKAKENSITAPPFLETSLYVSGIYSVQPSYDASYVITSLENIQFFLDKPNKLTSIELNTLDPNLQDLKAEIQDLFGQEFVVKDRYQQQAFLYKILQTEKWVIFFILSFILLIATFNIVASVIMIVLEKRKDISSLWAMGASEITIQKIFFYEGLLITFFGGGLGVLLGIAFCFLQQKFGFIKLGEEGAFIMSSYPVEVHMSDVILIIFTVLTIGVFITFIPVKILKRKFL